MRLNGNKVKHMYVNNINNVSLPLTLDNIALEEVNSYEWVGVLANSDMNYDLQWDVVLKRTNPHNYLIKQIKNGI